MLKATWFQRAREWLDSKGRPEARPDLAGEVLSHVQGLERRLFDRTGDILSDYMLYDPDFRTPITVRHDDVDYTAMRRNVIATGADTVRSELLQDNLRAMFVNRGGTWGHHRTAVKLTSWADGLVKDTAFQDAWSQVVLDGLIAGTGWLYPYLWGDELRTERIAPWHVLLDDMGGSDSPPPSIFVRRLMDRHQLLARAKDWGLSKADREAIEHMPADTNNIWHLYTDDAYDGVARDRIEVWEGWRVASDSDAKDGVHVLVVRGVVLVCEEYERTTWPPVAFRPLKPTRGFWGLSLVRRARNMQLALHDSMAAMEDAMLRHAHSYMIVPPGSDTMKAQFNNLGGNIYEHPTPERVFWHANPPMPEQAWMWPDRLKNWILEEFAVNEMQAQGTKPSGLDSGRALRVFVDTGSRRYVDMKRSALRTFCDFIRAAVCVKRAIAANDSSHEVVYKRRGVAQRIKWHTVDPDDKHHQVQPFPTNSLPSEPTGRIQALQELRADGTIDQETYWTLLDVADLENARDEALAPVEYIRDQLDNMLDSGTYAGPWPTHPLDRAIDLANKIIYKEARLGCPEEKLDLLRDYIEECNYFVQLATPPAPPMPNPAAMPMPAGVPGMSVPGPESPIPAGVPGMTLPAVPPMAPAAA